MRAPHRKLLRQEEVLLVVPFEIRLEAFRVDQHIRCATRRIHALTNPY